jgi:HAAS
MNLIDRYLSEVGKHLPRKNRQDIQRELRSILEDMLADRSQAAGQPVDEAMTVAVLKEYGSPQKVAASYLPKRYLIGPRLYPLFLLVTQIVVTVLFFVFLGLLVVSLYRSGLSGADFLSAASKFALNFVTGAVTALGYIVVAFAVIERSMSAQAVADELEEERSAWDPQSLAREPDPDEVKPAGSIFAILFLLLGLALFNLYPQWVGAWFVINGEWTHIPMLAPAFFTYLPWINLLIILEIGLHLVLLRRGRWGTGTRLANIVLNLAGILLAAAMLAGPALIELNPASFAGTPLADVTQTLSLVFGWLPDLILAILIVVQGVEVVQDVVHLARGRSSAL